MKKINSKVLFNDIKKVMFFGLICIFMYASICYAKDGNILFKAVLMGNDVSGLEVSVYKIADLNDISEFVLTEDFKSADVDLYDLDEDKIDKLVSISKDVSPLVVRTTDENGQIDFSDIGVGMYLFTQDTLVQTVIMQPTVASMPDISDLNNYTITVKPKLSEAPVGGGLEDESGASTLPYTGVLNIVVPALACLSLILFTIAWIIMFGSKKKVSN